MPQETIANAYFTVRYSQGSPTGSGRNYYYTLVTACHLTILLNCNGMVIGVFSILLGDLTVDKDVPHHMHRLKHEATKNYTYRRNSIANSSWFWTDCGEQLRGLSSGPQNCPESVIFQSLLFSKQKLPIIRIYVFHQLHVHLTESCLWWLFLKNYLKTVCTNVSTFLTENLYIESWVQH